MVFKWKDGARQTVSAQIAGEVCSALESEGRLTAKTLVDVNRPEDAPLHNAFEWDNDEAAERWREQQARNIIHSIVVVDETQESEPVRAFFNIVATAPEYESIGAIVKTEDKYRALMATALRELKAFQKKYSQLEELSPVFEAIEKVS